MFILVKGISVVYFKNGRGWFHRSPHVDNFSYVLSDTGADQFETV